MIIHTILSKRLSKETTTIHVDGPRSVEKEAAHQERDRALWRQLARRLEDQKAGRIKGTKALYRRIKAYRPAAGFGCFE
jgi:hypothetical protein